MTTFALILIAYCLPIMFLFGFYYGVKMAKSVYLEKDVNLREIPLGKAILRAETALEKKQETKEEINARILNDNIENYGTNIPQKDFV